MTYTRRHLCLALLLVLLVGHVGIAVHAASHVSGDSTHCELCFSFTNMAFVPSDERVQEFPDAGYEYALTRSDAAPSGREDSPYHPRGPPWSD